MIRLKSLFTRHMSLDPATDELKEFADLLIRKLGYPSYWGISQFRKPPYLTFREIFFSHRLVEKGKPPVAA